MRTRSFLAVVAAALITPAGIPAGAADTVGGGIPGDPVIVTEPVDDILLWTISADGSRVAYSTGDSSAFTDGVWIRPSTGGARVDVSGPLTIGNVSWIEFSPDGKYLVFTAALDTQSTTELYGFRLSNGKRIKLNGPISAGTAVDRNSIQFVPGTNQLIYSALTDATDAWEMYVVGADGTGHRKVHTDLSPDDSIDNTAFHRPHLTADGSRVVYLVNDSNLGGRVLYSADLATAATVKLSTDGVAVDSFAVSADDSTVVWKPILSASSALHAVPINGGSTTGLGGPVPAGRSVAEFAVSSDGQHALFNADLDTAGVLEAHSAPIDGSARIKLVESEEARFWLASPTGPEVLLRTSDGLVIVPASGGSPVEIANGLAGAHISFPQFTPDGTGVIFIADLDDPVLYVGNVNGGPPVAVSQPAGDFVSAAPAFGSFDEEFAVTPYEQVLFIGALEVHGIDKPSVYAANLDGSGVLELTDPAGGVEGRNHVLSGSGTNVLITDIHRLMVVSPRHVFCAGLQATHIGSAGRDRITGTSGPDVIAGLDGKDIIAGKGSGDTICGGKGGDTINGGAGADTIVGGKGRDTIVGGKGADSIRGKSGSDTLRGSAGSDQIRGGSGSDVLFGGADADTLFGQSGDDDMRGGSGADTCNGGSGTDTSKSCVAVNVP